LTNFDPPLPVTLCHTSWDSPKVRHTSRTIRFLVEQKTWTKAPAQAVQSISQWFAGFLFEGFVRGFLSGRFCPRRFLSIPLLSEYLHYNRKLTINFNVTFHMYDKNFSKCDVTCSWTPSPCHKLSHFLGPPSPSSVTYFMDGPLPLSQTTKIPLDNYITHIIYM